MRGKTKLFQTTAGNDLQDFVEKRKPDFSKFD